MTFDFIPTNDGLRIHDQIENVWCDIQTTGEISPTPAKTDRFGVPVDDAVTFRTNRLVFPNPFMKRVYDGENTVRDVFANGGRVEPAAEHIVDCTPSGMKAYVRVTDTGITFEAGERATFNFDETVTAELGVRSNHERPASVVTTTTDPEDVMRAISTFGSALKTLSPERSFPTLRGHPPELSVKSRLQIPDELAIPETDVTIEVAPSLDQIFTVTPLAYYLGATVRPGTEPAVVAGGEQFLLSEPDLPTAVHRILKQCFTLDCLVRTAGLYPFDLQELETVQEQIELDTEHLYQLPIGERTAAYLSYPSEVFQDILPWPRVTDLTPAIENAELLPYLTYRLSAIRSPPRIESRGSIEHTDVSPADRGPGPATTEARRELPTATLDLDGFLHGGLAGNAVPPAGNVPILDSYVTALQEEPTEQGISVHVVCTDADMAAEVRSLYPSREQQPLDVDISTDVTTHELTAILQSDIDLLHFVGHSTPVGLQCTDGVLDLRTLPPCRYPAFFINGCQSFYQGYELARNGSVGGIVSLEPIPNTDAITTGRLVANLLAYGCTFSQVVRVLDRWSSLDYTIIGDSAHNVIASTDYTPTIARFDIEGRDDETIPVGVEPIGEIGTELGVVTAPTVGPDKSYRIRAAYSARITYDEADILLDDHAPFVMDDELYWTSTFTDDELLEFLRP